MFFVKYYKEVLMHHIVQKKALHKYDGWSIMYLDGEFYQCESFIRDEELDRLLREHKVLIVKLPASTSSICQALDAGKIFLTTKKILRYLENFWHQRLLYQHIYRVFTDHSKESKWMKYKPRFIDAILKVVSCISEGITMVKVKKSFVDVGLITTWDHITIDIQRVLRNFGKYLSADCMEKFQQEVVAASKYLLQKGLTPDAYISQHFTLVRESLQRENRDKKRYYEKTVDCSMKVLYRARCVILNNVEMIQIAKEERVKREEKNEIRNTKRKRDAAQL